MEKRTMIALALSILVVVVFSQFIGPGSTPEEDATDRQTRETTRADTAPETVESSPGDTADTPERPDVSAEAPETATVVDAGETVPFSTEVTHGFFTLRGAAIGSVKLNEYFRFDDPNQHFDLVDEKGRGLLFELGYPNPRLADKTFQQISTDDPNSYRFRYTTENDVTVTKLYRFHPDREYQASLTVTLRNRSGVERRVSGIDFSRAREGVAGSAVRWGPGFGKAREVKTQLDQVYWYYGKNGEMEYLGLNGGGFWNIFSGGNEQEVEDQQFVRGPIEWTGASSRYFIAAVVPAGKSFDSILLNTEQGSDTFTAWSNHGPFTLKQGEARDFEYDMYLGPKEYYALQSFHPGLESTLNYGWFTVLALPLLMALNWTYAVIPNYGIAIIILSIVIKVLLYPLTKKGLVSMQKMRELQPKIKELQDKYEDDKEKLNKKMMEFYQEHNLNPVGGCLPMILQLPIFIGLYRMLEYSIELRGAPFFLWITDLSTKDPYYILPVLMGIIMFFQQKYTMTVGSTGGAMGQQQKMMMYVMPAVFVFMFMNFPVGLVLYWMTNSLATVVQYWFINRSMESA